MICSESVTGNYLTLLTDGCNEVLSDVVAPESGCMKGFWPVVVWRLA